MNTYDHTETTELRDYSQDQSKPLLKKKVPFNAFTVGLSVLVFLLVVGVCSARLGFLKNDSSIAALVYDSLMSAS